MDLSDGSEREDDVAASSLIPVVVGSQRPVVEPPSDADEGNSFERESSLVADSQFIAKAILKETDSSYLIEWAGEDSDGEPYEATWEPKENAGPELVRQWRLTRPARSSTKPSSTASRSAAPVASTSKAVAPASTATVRSRGRRGNGAKVARSSSDEDDEDADLPASEGIAAAKSRRARKKAAPPRLKRKTRPSSPIAPPPAAKPKAAPIDLTLNSTEDESDGAPPPPAPSPKKRRRIVASASGDDDVPAAVAQPAARSTNPSIDDSAPLEPGSLVPSLGGGRARPDPSPRPAAPAPPLPMRPVQDRVPTETQFVRAVHNARAYESDPVDASSQPVAGPSKARAPVSFFGAPATSQSLPKALPAVEPPHTQPDDAPAGPTAPRLSAVPRAPFAPPQSSLAAPTQQTDRTESIQHTQSPARAPPVEFNGDEGEGEQDSSLEFLAEPVDAVAANGAAAASDTFGQEAVLAALDSTTSNVLLTRDMHQMIAEFVRDPTRHWVRRAAYDDPDARNRADYAELRRAHKFGEVAEYDIELDMPVEFGGGKAVLTIKPNDGEWVCVRDDEDDEEGLAQEGQQDAAAGEDGEREDSMQVDDERQPDYDDIDDQTVPATLPDDESAPRDELVQARQLIASLQSEQTRLRAEWKLAEDRATASEQTIRTLSESAQRAEADTDVLRSDLATTQAQAERHRAEAASLRSDLQHARDHAQDLALRKTAEDAELAQLQGHHATLQRQHAALVSRSGSRQGSAGDLDEVRSARDRAQADAIGLNNALREAAERYDSLALAHRRATQQLDGVASSVPDPAVREEQAAREAELVAARSRIASLESKVKYADERYDTLRVEYEKAVEHVQILVATQRQQDAAIVHLKTQNQLAVRQRDAFHQAHVATLETENERLRAENALVRTRDERTGDQIRRDAALWRAYQQRKTALDYGGDDDSETDDEFVPPPEPKVVVAVARTTAVVKPAPAPVVARDDEDDEVFVCEWRGEGAVDECGFEAPHQGALIAHALAKHM